MWRISRMGLLESATGVLLALAVGAQDNQQPQAAPANLLPADELSPDRLDGLTRDQLASLYASLSGVSNQPPACVAGQEMFTDVPASHPFCRWIEELARRGITGGCTATQYCPNAAVTRAQMAVFIVKTAEEAEGCRPRIRGTGQMRKVGSFCIDRYENSLWTRPNGGMLLETEAQVDALCPDNGQGCKGKIFARSVAGVMPATNVTWFQAQAVLANSGKRLPTNAEWQIAAAGTPDSGATPGSEDCNTNSGGLEVTGERENCVSDWGAFDMVGNVWEMVADWGEIAVDCTAWPLSTYGSDISCIGLGEGELNTHLPGSLVRGGDYADGGVTAGPFAVIGFTRPSDAAFFFGFRGAR